MSRPSLLRRAMEGLCLVLVLVAGYGFGVALRRASRSAARKWRRAVDRGGAAWFARFARRQGGLLIKLAQYLASRPDIFPAAYVEACGPLRDQASSRPFAVIKRALAYAYEDGLDRHLPRIEEQALAAASFGQVHRAWLPDGTLVAVKVLYPDLGPRVVIDLALVRLTLWLLRPLLPGWPLGQFAAELTRTCRDEQDYLHEAAAADRLRAGLKPWGIQVPQVFWDHTRANVLVMGFAPGVTLASTSLTTIPAEERTRLAGMLIDGFLHMLLTEGFFHADPHGGNLIYDEQARQLWLIDFGMTAAIAPRERAAYRRFVSALRASDVNGMVEVLVDLGVVLPDADLDELRALVRRLYEEFASADPRRLQGSTREVELATQFAAFLRELQGVVLPGHTVALARATGLVEGLCISLVPDRSLLDQARPRLKQHLSWQTQLRDSWADLQETWRRYRRFPDDFAAFTRTQRQPPWGVLVAALLLIAALLLPSGPIASTAAIAAALAVAMGAWRG